MKMEGIKKVMILDSRENGSSSSSADGKPPNPLSTTPGYRRSFSGPGDVGDSSSIKKSLVRHPSLVRTRMSDASVEPTLNPEDYKAEFVPFIRSGAWADMGVRGSMEDVFIRADSFVHDYGGKNPIEGPGAFYAVFDGHGGKHAADFACYHLPRFIFEDNDFPMEIERVIAAAFAHTDSAFAEACTLDADLASGTTALAALVIGSSLVVANAGDCRAVLCRRGKAIEMSRDHKPICMRERKRIEASGGYVYDGYLNGQLNVARAIGDWHMDGLKHEDGGPLSCEPEFMTTKLTEEDEFLIIGCDGIWDVFMSQNAVDFARRKLQEHNDPVLCSKDLVNEALKRKSGDNLSAVVVCFQSQPPPNLVVPRGRVQRSISAEGLKELQSFLDGLET
ncbi:probable protein phosphatase 2C 22 isoform X1 [Cynara cardunculus var. scolymus]|uniref:protein-serine/threonine phosphatase n=2 Tax=Cynara cardunculus var. scolymus TaxID=59895 RepID=A0A103PU55_CYNCS|nr:probable protein phosphatase 2C 22 isoform X1 [Cynara cardunculus var. scolymus]XP_024964637.1 probable protein phosphatase 2C 22 isoform X1 [Cynara cardunculus var. scolymus]KVG37214.1 Protein phosphatase 2C [Cynara cardunculus var. scolymus]